MSNCPGHFNRRDVLKSLGGGAMAAAFGSTLLRPGRVAAQAEKAVAGGGRQLFTPYAKPAKVSVVKGNDRREIIFQAFKNIEDEILASIGNKKRILVKPNFVSTTRALAATHADAIRGILDFLKPRYQDEIIVGESAAGRGGTFEGYQNFGYMPLEKEYGIKLVDLNKQPWVYRYVFGNGPQARSRSGSSRRSSIRDTYIISAAKMKTHDRAVTTLSLKNILIGAPLNDGKKNDKGLTHHGIQLHAARRRCTSTCSIWPRRSGRTSA